MKTQNPAPACNCNSRFPPLFSAQIPNITAKKSQIPHPAKPIGDPCFPLQTDFGKEFQNISLQSEFDLNMVISS